MAYKVWEYCLQCGDVFEVEVQYEGQSCVWCGGKTESLDTFSDEINEMSPSDFKEWKEKLLFNVIMNNPLFKRDKYSFRLAETARESTTKAEIRPPEVRCPKCGSTQIQAVTRKWSLLTGFLTNKVDRVCLNCKCKF